MEQFKENNREIDLAPFAKKSLVKHAW